MYLGLFRRRKTRALRSERIMQWKVRLNVEVSRTREKYRLISTKSTNYCNLSLSGACFDAGLEACTKLCTHDAVKRAFRRRSITNGREISLNFTTKSTNYCNLRVSGLVSTLDERSVLRSARIMQWKELLDVEVSQKGEKNRLIFYKIDALLQLAGIWACFDDGKRVH